MAIRAVLSIRNRILAFSSFSRIAKTRSIPVLIATSSMGDAVCRTQRRQLNGLSTSMEASDRFDSRIKVCNGCENEGGQGSDLVVLDIELKACVVRLHTI